jgi:hypothetical protein
MVMEEAPQQTDADGDDEDDHASSGHQTTPRVGSTEKENKKPKTGYESSDDEFFRTPMTAIPRSQGRASALVASPSEVSFKANEPASPSKRWTKPLHNRNTSTGTILFSPVKETMPVARAASPEKRPKTSTRTGTATGTATPGRLDGSSGAGTRTPKRAPAPQGAASRPRVIMPPRGMSANLLGKSNIGRGPSFNAIALDLASELGDNNINPNFDNLNGLPASFTTQFEMAARMKAHEMAQKGSDHDSDSNRMSRIMLARMTTLEEGFRDMLQEVKGLKQGDSQVGSRGTHTPPNEPMKKKGKAAKKKNIKRNSEEERRMGSSL